MLEKCQKTNFKRADVFRILIRKTADFAYCLQLLLYCCNINEIRERQDILVPTFSGLWLILYCYPAGSPCLSLMCSTMVIRIVEFASGGTEFERFLPKNQHRYSEGNDWILRIELMGRCQKVPKFDFQSQFSMSNIIQIFINFFHLRISI